MGSYGESHFLILHFIVTTSVEMVDVGIQSEAEDLSDTELSAPVTVDRKPSVLEAVPEEEHEDIELVITLFTPESKELVHLVLFFYIYVSYFSPLCLPSLALAELKRNFPLI